MLSLIKLSAKVYGTLKQTTDIYEHCRNINLYTISNIVGAASSRNHPIKIAFTRVFGNKDVLVPSDVTLVSPKVQFDEITGRKRRSLDQFLTADFCLMG